MVADIESSRRSGIYARAIMRLCIAFAVALISTTLFGLFPLSAFAYEPSTQPELAEAKAAEICDQDGTILYSYHANEEMPMASITKVMTAMVALDSSKDLDATCKCYKTDFQADAQMIGFTKDDSPTLRQLLMAMLVYSGNDAAYDVALNVSGSEDAFVERMNQKAKALGMKHTHFENPHGLEQDGHYSCAHDLVIMGRYALEHYPFIAQAVLTRSYTLKVDGVEKTFNSTDHLMDTYPGLCGIKTGAVESGKSFLGAAKRRGVRLYSCVLNCSTGDGRFADTQRLMDWSLDGYYKERHFARATWPLRVASWSLGFSPYKVVVTSERAIGGIAIPGNDLSYNLTTQKPGSLLNLDQSFGYESWTQGSRTVARATLSASRRLWQVPDINVFALPLFIDVLQLGGSA